MAINKERKKLIALFNKELNLYLKCYEPTHPNFKRNMKNMYEGLIDLGILDNPNTPQTFREFKQAFETASKDLKKVLIMTHLFDVNDLGKYFQSGNVKLNRIKMIGGLFLSKAVKSGLSEESYIQHHRAKAQHEELHQQKKLVSDVKKGLKELEELIASERFKKAEQREHLKDLIKEAKQEGKHLVKLTKEESDKLDSIVQSYRNTAQNIMKTYDIHLTPLYKRQTSWEEQDISYEQNKELAKFELEQTEKALKELINSKQFELHKFEELQDKLISNINFKTSITQGQIKALTDRLQLMRPYVENFPSRINTEIPNVVEGYTDMIECAQWLHGFLEYCDSKRMAMDDPWNIMTYGTDGPDKRSFHIGPWHGERKEGFWFDPEACEKIDAEIGRNYRLCSFFADVSQSKEVSEGLTSLKHLMYRISELVSNEPEFFEHQHGIRNPDGTRGYGRQKGTGYILNAEEHTLTVAMCEKIQSAFVDVINEAGSVLTNINLFNNAQNEYIKQAKSAKRSVGKMIAKIDQKAVQARRIEAKSKYISYKRDGEEGGED